MTKSSFKLSGSICNVRIYNYIGYNVWDGLANEKKLFRPVGQRIHHRGKFQNIVQIKSVHIVGQSGRCAKINMLCFTEDVLVE